MSLPMKVAANNESEPRPHDRLVLADHAYETLRGLILDRQITPESWMAIDALARDLGISQTPIREALARLASDGLVARQANGRYRTEPLLTKTSFNKLYDVRLQLEPFAAGEAAKQIAPDELAALKLVEASMRKAPIGNVSAKFSDFTAGNATFHAIIATATRNPFLLKAINDLHSHYRLAQLYLHHGVVDAAPALEEHAQILGAIAQGKARQSVELMRAHIKRSRRELETLIDSD